MKRNAKIESYKKVGRLLLLPDLYHLEMHNVN